MLSLHSSDYLIDSQIPEFSEIFVSTGYHLQDGFNAVDYKMTEHQLYRLEVCAYSMQMEASTHSSVNLPDTNRKDTHRTPHKTT